MVRQDRIVWLYNLGEYSQFTVNHFIVVLPRIYVYAHVTLLRNVTMKSQKPKIPEILR